MTANELQTFEPFAKEIAYVRVNEKLVRRLLAHLKGLKTVRLLDVASSIGLMTTLANREASAKGLEIQPTLLDLDLPALTMARHESNLDSAQYVYGTAFSLPFQAAFDASIFANSLHLLDDDAKTLAVQEVRRVLKPGGFLAINTTFYDGAYPEESKPFYTRWLRRSIAEINQRLPNRSKSEKVQAMEWLSGDDYRNLLTCNGFEVVESRERRVLLSQSAVRAISSYSEFAKGALHATDEDAEEAARALRVTVQRTFNDLHMKMLPRNWLEIIARRV